MRSINSKSDKQETQTTNPEILLAVGGCTAETRVLLGTPRRSGVQLLSDLFVVICILASLHPCIAADKTVAKIWQTKADWLRCTTDGNIEIADDGTVRLKKSVLLQDEQGATHYNNAEKLSPTTWAKKQFVVDDPGCDKAELFAFDGSGAKVTCNGTVLTDHRKLPSTGWNVWTVPPNLLRKGANEFVFSDTGSLLIESSLFPNRSAKSHDGGKTWDFGRLGFEGVENGEYVVRLRLAQYPTEGMITSEVVDLASLSNDHIRPLVRQTSYTHPDLRADADNNTSVQIDARSRPMALDASSIWSDWGSLSSVLSSSPFDPVEKCPRYFQVRWILKTTSAQYTPAVKRYGVSVGVQQAPASIYQTVESVELNPVKLERSSYPFAYQPPYHRLDLLRKRYKLDDVVAPGATELEKFVLLREWCRFTAPNGWDSGATAWCPPWDALIILETNKTPLALCMCTHYSTLFVQAALALGFTARHVILDHHCVAEIWSNQFRKWMLIDTGCSTDPTLNCHFESNGLALNALEIRRLWKAGRTNEIEVVYTGARGRINGADIGKKNQCGFENYRRFAIPFRNNHLMTPFPGELEQGQSEYYGDFYLWWEDQAVPTESPEYGKTSCRPVDFYWSLNETVIDLVAAGSILADAAGIKPAVTVDVTLTTVTPNFEKFIVSIDGDQWEARPASFVWKLHSGENALRVKSVNKFGVSGPESITRIKLGP